MKKISKFSIYFLLLIALNPRTSFAERVSAEDLTEIIRGVNQASKQHKINPYLLLAVIRAESNFNRYAQSHAGARGLMQLMPMTQNELGVIDVFDINQNISGGASYLIQQIRKYNNVRKALWAYNTGPGNVSKGVIPRETRLYANQVIQFYNHYKNRGQP